MLSFTLAFVIAYIALVFIVSGVGLAWSGILLKKDNLFDWLVPYLRRIKSKPLRNLLQCHKCVSGQFALWSFGIAWVWYGWSFNPLLLFLWVAWILSVVVVTDWLYVVLKLDQKEGVPLPETDKFTQNIKVEITKDGTVIPAATSDPDSARKTLQNKRDAKDSVLLQQKLITDKLRYHPYNPEAVFLAEFISVPKGVTEELTDSKGAVREEIMYGTINFKDQEHSIKLKTYYKGEELFVPFADQVHGLRYLTLPIPESEQQFVIVDFNYAYNPHCAYSDVYACPQAPADNWLKVIISAGEKPYQP